MTRMAAASLPLQTVHSEASISNHHGIRARRADLDWLRVIAFGLLIFFHAAMPFIPGGIPMIQNSELSPVLQIFVGFLHEFRLSLLFLVSGVGVCFALRHRSRAEFFRDRAIRLLVPFVFGVLVIVPPMIFLEKRFNGVFAGSFLAFYPRFFTEGVYPKGNLSWHQYWFIAYLYLFCLIGWPLFAWLNSASGRERVQRWGTWTSSGFRLYLAILPLVAVEIALRVWFPGFRDLIHDWASFSNWFLVFVAGFLFASSEALLDRACAMRGVSLLFAGITTTLLFGEFWSWPISSFTPLNDDTVRVFDYLWFCVLRAANAWFWLLVCLGYAGRYLRRANRVLAYLNDAVYPFFCLHLTAMVAISYTVIPMDWPVGPKYLTIVVVATVAVLITYEGAIRRTPWLRPLVGLKPVIPVNPAPLCRHVVPSAPRDE